MASRAPVPEPSEGADSYPGTPRWVKAIGIVLLVVLLLAAFVVVSGLGGPHGPQRHGAGALVASGLASRANA